MVSRASGGKPKQHGASGPKSVEALLASLDHPFKPEILALRGIILGADPSIAEGVKWNAPSFHTSEHFATFNLQAKDGVQVILHFGARQREGFNPGPAISDPESVLLWLGPDRASANFKNLEDVEAKRLAFAAVIRRWIEHLGARSCPARKVL